jgi:hypothetical protein
MKIHVSLPLDFKESQFNAFIDGVNYLKKQGHNVTVDSSLKSSKKVEKSIRDTDILLVETTGTDLKVGYDISKALNEKKIVIALENEGSRGNTFNYVSDLDAKNLIVKKYNNKNIEESLDKAMDNAKKLMDTKFILIISPEIDRYLDWASQTKRMHKAQLVRNSIESAMKKDKDYRNFLGE